MVIFPVSLFALLISSCQFLNNVSAFTTTTTRSPAFLQGQQQRQREVIVSNSNIKQQYQRSYSQQHVLYMGWGPEPIWSEAKIQRNVNACSSGLSVLLTIAVDPEVAAEYKVPGQYVQMRLDDSMEKPLFLAIASGPPSDEEDTNSAAQLEFLVKKTDSNDWLTSIDSGAAVQVSQVLGSGYKMQENLEGFKYDFPTQNILLFAAGSGIAPIKAAIESGALGCAAGGRTARLYYGERTESDLCCVDCFPKWEELGVEVVPVLSQPSSTSTWQGRTGYVQTALEEDGIAIPRNSGALLCGMKGMTEAVKDLLLKAGVFEGRVLFNF